MKTKNVRTTWAALLTAALLLAPAVTWGQATQRGVRVVSKTDVTKVNTTEITADGQVLGVDESSTPTITVVDKTAEGKVAKVTVTKVTDLAASTVTVSGGNTIDYNASTTLTLTADPTYADGAVSWRFEAQSDNNSNGSVAFSSQTALSATNGQATVSVKGTGAGKVNVYAKVGNVESAAYTVTINKAAGAATLSPSSVDFGTTTDNKTVTVSGNTGTVSSASVTSGSGCEVVSVSGNTITIKRNSNEAFNATVTVTIDASTNYNTTTKNITVKGSAVYQAGDVVSVTMGDRQFVKLYTSATNGYYIALNDKYTGYPGNTGVNWGTACDASASAGGKTFRCGSLNDWEKIISACGGADARGYACINTKCKSVTGWVNMSSGYYWTSTNGDPNPLCFSWDDQGAMSSQDSDYGVRLIAPF